MSNWKTTQGNEKIQQNKKAKWNKSDFRGKITEYIGTGENAKHSIVYLVLKYSFLSACFITVLIVVNYWFFVDVDRKVHDFVGDIEFLWDIYIPIITLSLGYAFGKFER